MEFPSQIKMYAHSSGLELPLYRRQGRSLGVVFEHMNVLGATASGGGGILDLPTMILRIAEFPVHLALSMLGNRAQPTKHIVQDVTGVLFPGETMLVLGRPGSGCSTVLKALANEHDPFVDVQGKISYGNISPSEMSRNFRSETVYASEDDIHFPTLSTQNTMSFAYKLRKPVNLEQSDSEFATQQTQKMLSSLGIAHTKDTIVGDAFVRGVSGGERKRVTLAEALSINSAYGSWDNPIRGLDSSSATQFLRLLKSISTETGMANSVSLYQASETMYQECFDRVMVLYEGRMIFCGKVSKAKQYFEDLGFECLPRQTTPDFLTAVTSPAERKIRSGHKGVPSDPQSMAQAFLDSEHYRHLLNDIGAYYNTVAERHEYTQSFKEASQNIRSRLTVSTAIAPRSVFKQTTVAISRYYQLIWGDKRTLCTVMAFNVVNAVINGSAYYKAPKTATGSFEKSGALFFSLIYFFLNALTEASATINSRSVLLKQLKYGFINPASYVIAQTVADIPVAAFQTIVFSCLYYFMLGLAKNASDFWTFFLFVFVHYGAVQGMFRMLGAWSPNMSVALLMAGSGMPVALLYSGYAPTIPTMHRWGSWIRRISPSPWALEALMANEFADINLSCTENQLVPSGPGYDSNLRHQGCTITGSRKGSDTVSGVTYLNDQYGFLPSHIWRNFGIILVLWFLYTVIAAVGLTVMTRESSGSYVRIFKKSSSPKSTMQSNGDPEKGGGLQSYSPSSSSTELDSNMPQEELERCRTQSKAVFTFEKLNYYVHAGGIEKQLLTDVSGYVRPGQLTALMGASGAGKTTLLDTLSQRKSEGRIEGQILFNGHPLDNTFARTCGFVMQQDIHEPTATIREALQFSARLRQPEEVPDSEKMAYVEHILHLLDLEHLADAIIGGEGQLSVEEKKRVTIGVELAARPSALLFLDEPTSGLDSQAAYQLISFLKMIALEGLPIVCTIHQPSGVLFDMFDHILLLAPGGKTVYFGETGKNSINVVNYFGRYGAIIGQDDNPAEFILGTVTGRNSTRDWVSTWNESPERHEMENRISALNAEAAQQPRSREQDGRHHALSYKAQIILLTKRHWIAIWRNGPYNFSRLFKSIFCEIFIAFSFFKAKPDVQGLQNHMLALLLLAWIIPATAADIQNIWFEKWAIFAAREKNGIYQWSALLTALMVVEVPWQICFYTIIYLCTYWTVGFPSNPTIAGFQYFMSLLLSLFGTSYSQLLAALFPNAAMASYANSLFWVILMLFSGVLVPHSAMNKFYKPWLFWTDPMRYYFGGSVGNVLHGLKARCSPRDFTLFDPMVNQTCGEYASAFLISSPGYISNPDSTSNCSYCPYSTGDDYSATLGYGYSTKWRDFAVFLGFCFTNIACIYVIMWWQQGRSQRRA
ncbi:hypothetical protein ASPFODRAFT_223676 [Aspergillus luchuensis CBS 106.47]|uniref:ABC transporter domain-containing protein n=1 Tax=Aspergillus luchuensis (strain CBS 106.47) TaxID=1137211 RepID=A0A1M3T0E0_ASPLC|nr:hypothetical protein ASPFODRAFT_223676 [Aspergillus luchuensis CBS 106.47]